MVASYEIVGLSNIVTTFLPPFVHMAWDELNHRNTRQLRSLASHDFPEKKRLPYFERFSAEKLDYSVAFTNKTTSHPSLRSNSSSSTPPSVTTVCLPPLPEY